MMKLSKIIPASTRTFTAYACMLEFTEMTPTFRQIRSKCLNKMDSCHWCRTSFNYGDMIALALTHKGNKALCQLCGKQLIESKDESTS